MAKLVASTLALGLAFFGLALMASDVSPATAAEGAGQPFDCSDPRFFAMVGGLPGSHSQLYVGRYVTDGSNPWSTLGDPSTANYNALALNTTDHYLYGVSPNGTLYRIDSAGVAVSIAPGYLGPAAATLWESGEIFDDTYFIANQYSGGTTIHKIANLSAGAGAFVHTTLTIPNIKFADLTYKDGFLWAISYNGSGLASVYRIDPSDGTTTTIATPLGVAAYGAAFTMNNGNLAFISASTMFQVAVASPEGAAPVISLVNSIGAPANSQSDATNCDAEPANLTMTKTGPSTVLPEASISWDLAITNEGPGNSSGFVVTEQLPAGLTNVSVTGPAVCKAPDVSGKFTCSGGALAVGGTVHLTVTANAPKTEGSIVNTATVTGNELEPLASNNVSSPSTSVTSQLISTTPDLVNITAGGGPIDIDVLDNDTVDGGTVTAVSVPSSGTAAINADNTSVRYTPAAGFSGEATFTYTARDDASQESTETVTVTVDNVFTAGAGVSTGHNQSVKIDVGDIATTSAKPVDPLTLTIIGTPANGAATVDSITGEVTFVPTPGFSGAGSFDARLCDTSSPVQCSTFTLPVTIGMNAVVADHEAVSTGVATPMNIDVLAGDTSSSGQPLALPTIVTPATNGLATVLVGGTVDYTPAAGFSGIDSFEYRVCDTSTPTAVCDTGTVTITVTPDAPSDLATTPAGRSVVIDVLANDTGTGLTITSFTVPGHGTVTEASGVLTYTPDAGFSGFDSFDYTATDSAGLGSTATVSLSITPAAAPDSKATVKGGTVRVNLLGNDLGSGLMVTSVTQPANGTLVLNADGTATYTPRVGFSGSDSFSYTVTDAAGQSVVSVATVDVELPTLAQLPATGSQPNSMLLPAALLLLIGAVLVALTPRRVARHRA